MKKAISVYHTDKFQYCVTLEPMPWEGTQRLVTEEEHARIVQLEAYRNELQSLLSDIAARPEYEPLENPADDLDQLEEV